MWFLGTKQRQSVVLIDIGSSAVGGGYVHYEEGKLPVIYYTVRLPIEKREGEELKSAMLRTLDLVGNELIETGAPTLRRETGSGHIDGVLVSVSSPWQETKVRTETINPGKPFTFTKRILSEAVSSNAHIPEGRVSFGESVIATILNGYDIPNPIGKKVSRAEVVVLSSTLEKDATDEIRARIRKLYLTHTITFTAFAPVAYAVLRDTYPHERDFLVLEVSNESTNLAFVKGGLLVDVGTLPNGIQALLLATHAAERMTVDEEQGLAAAPKVGEQPGYINPGRNARFSVRAQQARDEWLKALTDLFREFAQMHALPRTLFLITQPEARDYLKRAIDSDLVHALWLSDEPLSVITVLPEQFASRVRARASADCDSYLSILALYQQKLIGK